MYFHGSRILKFIQAIAFVTVSIYQSVQSTSNLHAKLLDSDDVFVAKKSAGSILELRRRTIRSNKDLYEETRKADLERECFEETCSIDELNEAVANLAPDKVEQAKANVLTPCKSRCDDICKCTDTRNLLAPSGESLCSFDGDQLATRNFRCFAPGTSTCNAQPTQTPYFACSCRTPYRGVHCNQCRYPYTCSNGVACTQALVNKCPSNRAESQTEKCQSCSNGFELSVENSKCGVCTKAVAPTTTTLASNTTEPVAIDPTAPKGEFRPTSRTDLSTGDDVISSSTTISASAPVEPKSTTELPPKPGTDRGVLETESVFTTTTIVCIVIVGLLLLLIVLGAVLKARNRDALPTSGSPP